MYRLLWALLALASCLYAEELKVVADRFETDDATGVSVFMGAVKIAKGSDELNASKVTVEVDEARKPIRFTAEGNVSFLIHTETGDVYAGKAQTVRFKPQSQEYHFYTGVHLTQLNRHNEISGDEVTVNLQDGKAYAKGGKAKPVIMVFELDDANTTLR